MKALFIDINGFAKKDRVSDDVPAKFKIIDKRRIKRIFLSTQEEYYYDDELTEIMFYLKEVVDFYDDEDGLIKLAIYEEYQ